MNRQVTFLALLTTACSKCYHDATPDAVAGAISAFKRDGLPSQPDPSSPEGKTGMAERCIEASVVLARLGFTTQAKKLAVDALVYADSGTPAASADAESK